jgi:hypothetical protein
MYRPELENFTSEMEEMISEKKDLNKIINVINYKSSLVNPDPRLKGSGSGITNLGVRIRDKTSRIHNTG